MVTGDYVKCTTEGCGHEYRIRFNVGNVFPQKGTFKCKTCGANLTYGWDKDHQKMLQGIAVVEPNDSAIVQNIHPELPIDPSRESDPYYFPSPDYIMKYNQEKDGKFDAFRQAQKSMANFKTKLDELEPSLRYLKETRWKLLEGKYGKNQPTAEKKVIKEALEVDDFLLMGNGMSFIGKV